MYKIGDRIIYGAMGVCDIKAIGPLDIKGADRSVDYYTLSPVYQEGKIFAPVNTDTYIRPILTKQEALELIGKIPEIEEGVFEDNNPRLLNEHYKIYLKSGDCVDLLRLIREIYCKGRRAKENGRRLGQVDEQNMKRAQELLHNELACALEIKPNEVSDFITKTLEG